jgi:hypothetical protein
LGARQPALLALPLVGEAVDMMVLHLTAGVSECADTCRNDAQGNLVDNRIESGGVIFAFDGGGRE